MAQRSVLVLAMLLGLAWGGGLSLHAAPGSWSGTLNALHGPANPYSIPLTVGKGELVTVSVSGQIKLGQSPWSGPVGCDYYGWDDNGNKPPFGYTHGIAMLVIDQNHLPIEGGNRTLESPQAGQLSLYVNDDNTADNQGSFTVQVTIGPGLVGDTDEDGLDDALEDQLLEQYAPHYFFDEGEDDKPADVYWFLRNADLLVSSNETSTKILDRKQNPYYPEWFLCQSNQGQSTNYLDVPAIAPTWCNIRNSHRTGQEWDRVMAARNIGCYGHVVPVEGSVAGQWKRMILLQYCQFYAFSDTSAAFVADHEGDWETVQVFLDADDPTNVSKMQRVIYNGHGLEYTAKWEAGIWSYQGTPQQQLPAMPQAHVPVHVENGSHGSWPCHFDYGTGLGDTRGNGYHYIARNITNVGEIYRPRLGTEVVTQYNGRWGAYACCFDYVKPPAGPALHRTDAAWVDSPGGNSPAIYVGSWNNGNKPRNGRISWPHASVATALNTAADHQSILIYPGNYPESLSIARPLTFGAPHGSVQLGPTTITAFLYLRGPITFTADLVNAGQLSLSPHQSQVVGNMVNGNNAVLQLNLGGPSDYSRLQVGGQVRLAGQLQVVLGSGYTPAAGEQYVLCTADDIQVEFDNVALPTLPSDRLWRLTREPNRLVLSVLVHLAGDFDRDGDVDLSDFGHLQSCLNGPWPSPVPENCDDADLDSDDDVDGGDLHVFRSNLTGWVIAR